MIKQVFFTADHTQDDDRNSIRTFNSFQYDVETKELKFVAMFNGQKFEKSFGIASLVEDNTSGVVTDNTNTDTNTNTNDDTNTDNTETNNNEDESGS